MSAYGGGCWASRRRSLSGSSSTRSRSCSWLMCGPRAEHAAVAGYVVVVAPVTTPAGVGGGGRRRWRALERGAVRAVLEADVPRVTCGELGVVVAGAPWGVGLQHRPH